MSEMGDEWQEEEGEEEEGRLSFDIADAKPPKWEREERKLREGTG
jgi:hypothetical protein